MARVVATMFLLSVVACLFASDVFADTHTDCGVAETAFSFCVGYVVGVDSTMPPNCCAGMKSVSQLVPSPMSPKDMCGCLKGMLMSAGGSINAARVGDLSRNCGVQTAFLPTAASFNCNIAH